MLRSSKVCVLDGISYLGLVAISQTLVNGGGLFGLGEVGGAARRSHVFWNGASLCLKNFTDLSIKRFSHCYHWCLNAKVA